MPSGFLLRSLGHAAGSVPGLRRVPMLKLLSAAQVAMLAQNHLARLTPAERRRLFALVRTGHGRRTRLNDEERSELEALLVKLNPRLFLGTAVDRLSPMPLPGRMLYGRRRDRLP